MERPAHRLSPKDTFEDAVRLFDEHAVEMIAVLDELGALQGIVTKNELFHAFELGWGPSTTVQELMFREPVMATRDQTPLAIAELMHKHDIDWMPVVESEETRRVIGIIRSERMLRRLVSHMPDEPGAHESHDGGSE